MKKEIWKDIIHYEGYYQLSNSGKCKSLARTTSNNHIIKEHLLNPWLCKNGYYYITLCKNGKQNSIKRSRLIAKAFLSNFDEGLLVDHRDGCTTNDRISNLRMATYSQNAANTRIKTTNRYSMFKGVTYDKDRNKWMAKIKYQGKTINLGRFLLEEDAGHSYDKRALKLFGEFACTNEMLGLYEKEK